MRLRARWEEDSFLEKDPHQLAVVEGAGPAVGLVIWQDTKFGGVAGKNWEIGILLAPEVRGRGVGTEAQRLLVEHLFSTTPVHPLSAWTEVDDLANSAPSRCAGCAAQSAPTTSAHSAVAKIDQHSGRRSPHSDR